MIMIVIVVYYNVKVIVVGLILFYYGDGVILLVVDYSFDKVFGVYNFYFLFDFCVSFCDIV